MKTKNQTSSVTIRVMSPKTGYIVIDGKKHKIIRVVIPNPA